MYKVESDFDYKGYRCVTTFNDTGFRCGYVGLPEGHPLYNVGFDDKIEATFDSIEGQSIGKRSPFTLIECVGLESEDKISPVLFFNVHGGLTYSEGGKGSEYPVLSDLWWFGFDCGHYGDLEDIATLKELWGDDNKGKMIIQMKEDMNAMFPELKANSVVRTVEFVQNECRSLVDQIIAYCTRYENGYFRKVIKLEDYK